MAMNWIIARTSGATKKTLGAWIEGRDGWEELWPFEVDKNRKRAVEGLSGMIVLGGAWESPDMFEALGEALAPAETVTLRHIAILRAQELLLDGKPSLGGLKLQALAGELHENAGVGQKVAQENFIPLAALFSELRLEANNWNATRNFWMQTKLEKGEHPDTNADFWQGYTESPPPSLDMKWFARPSSKEMERYFFAVFKASLCGIGALLCGVALFVIKRRKRRANLT